MGRNHWMAVVACALFLAAPAHAAVKTQTVAYEHGGVKLIGHLAWDDAQKGRRPGVLVVHEWWGLNDYARKRAEQLAGLGFVAFAVDMYGEGKTTTHPHEAREMSTAVREDSAAWLGRAHAGLKVLRDNPMVDPHQVAAIGYCFGGSTALMLAYDGADLATVVTFHGSLMAPTAEQARRIKAKILICHGALDPVTPESTIQEIRGAFEKAKVDYEINYYGGAVHGFTVPEADKVGMKGMAYNARADARSWRDMLRLFGEVFSPPE